MSKTTKDIIHENIINDEEYGLSIDKLTENDKWYSQEKYDKLKELYELTKVSHTEMCETVVILRKHIESHKLDLDLLAKELKEKMCDYVGNKYKSYNEIIDDVFTKFKELR